MPANKKTQEYVKNELPYKLLMSVYHDSRASLREIGKELDISYHVISSSLRELEERYELIYTLDLDETKLGFTEGILITIKFGIKPSTDFIKEKIKKDFFIQSAYLAEGDFDLLLYIVGVDTADFQQWQWQFRVSLSKYKPTLKLANVSSQTLGFFPLRSDLIKETTLLSKSEKAVLVMLNDNSRVKLRDIVMKLKITPDRVVYIIKKLKKMGIIKRFTALVQNPSKRIFYAYCVSLIPVEEHSKLIIDMAHAMLKEDLRETVNDYAIVANTNGGYDAFYLCAFKNGEDLSKRGPEMLRTAWMAEDPKIDRAVLTDIIVGKWPFHLEEYKQYKAEIAHSK
ncbi:Winged helix DNA-binding domain protein [uncultured archaeon]|nr:Winged helix DNA-binding domain protein [uncultured archaeon]